MTANGPTIYRLRAGDVLDQYSQKQIPADWSDPQVGQLDSAWIGPTSTSLRPTESRAQASETVSLYCDPDADIQAGDRIRVGADGGPVYTIAGIPPEAPTNPFTGWRPVREIPLERYAG